MENLMLFLTAIIENLSNDGVAIHALNRRLTRQAHEIRKLKRRMREMEKRVIPN